MRAQVETTLRGPDSYGLARRVVDEMQAANVWPTPVNFELWLHYLGDPEGALGREIQRLLAAQEPFTDATSEMLAAEYLPRGRLSEEIRDAGRVLDRELASVADAISKALKSQSASGDTLADASAGIEKVEGPDGLKTLVTTLTAATRKVQNENAALEKKLETSTREVAKLREHLEQVRRDAMTDALTNLANRKAFDEHLSAACEAEDADSKSLTLAVIDIGRPAVRRHRSLQALQRHLGPSDRRPGASVRRQRPGPRGASASYRGPLWRRGIRHDLPQRERRNGRGRPERRPPRDRIARPAPTLDQ